MKNPDSILHIASVDLDVTNGQLETIPFYVGERRIGQQLAERDGDELRIYLAQLGECEQHRLTIGKVRHRLGVSFFFECPECKKRRKHLFLLAPDRPGVRSKFLCRQCGKIDELGSSSQTNRKKKTRHSFKKRGPRRIPTANPTAG
ncbi:hypothetical protein [Afipia felis]|uniref:hypothetical protein n=1 Tax=Afipia felis TaxID=1035 RepID=UPI0012E216B1|nr:hypothetical protein [Afipia felis]